VTLEHTLAALTRRPTRLFEAFLRQEERLVAAGWHPTSEHWLADLRRFWDAEPVGSAEFPPYRKCDEKGRRAGKSTTIVRVATCEVVDREWTVPSGDPCHAFAFFSVKLGEAVWRLDGVEQVLAVREVPHVRGDDRYGPFIRLLARPLEWRAIVANHRTAVGFTLVGYSADELARWIDTANSANPASHVLAAARPAISSHLREGAHEYLLSSPMTEEGIHCELCAQGDTEDQMVTRAATWDANPSLTEEDCRRLARAEQLSGQDVDFDRDYRAIPTPLSVVGRLDPALIVWLEAPPEPHAGDMVVSGSDLAMKTNSSAQAIALIRRGAYLVTHLEEWEPTGDAPLRPSQVCADHRANLLRLRASSTMADGHYRESLREAMQGTELQVLDAPAQSAGPIIRLRETMREGIVRVWCTPEMRERLSVQLRGTRLVPTQNGLKVDMRTARDGSHCDVVAALALAVWQQAGPSPVVVAPPPKTHKQAVIEADTKRRRADQRARRAKWY
jgi:hypothetical protein